jgi:uncharacterized repeat protein (TIGR01451 family)
MSLLGTWFKRFTKLSAPKQRARRLFLEPLEGRQLLAADLRTTIEHNTTVTAGTELIYTITVTNVSTAADPNAGGTEAAENVILNIDLPDEKTGFLELQLPNADWEFVTQSPPTPGSSESFDVRRPTTPLELDQPQVFTLRVFVLPDATGTIAPINPGASTAPTPEANLGDDSDFSDPVTIQVVGDLTITKTDNQDTVPAGNPVNYVITITNFGPSDVVGASIQDIFPTTTLTGITWTSTAIANPNPEPDFVPAPLPTGNTAAGAGNINDVNVNLPVGSSITYNVTATAGASGTISNTATATVPAGTTDPNSAGGVNTATDTTTIIGSGPTADLQIDKSDTATTAIPGQSLTYRIVVTNAGPEAVTGAQVTDTFSSVFSGVQYTASATGNATGFTALGGGNINDTVNMPVGSTITYLVTATIPASAPAGPITNTATVTPPAGANDLTPGNNADGHTHTLVPTADITITKTETPPATSSSPGQQITYVIVVSNETGPSNIVNATVTDIFDPSKYSVVNFTSTASGSASGNTNGSGNINDTVSLPVGSAITYTVIATVSPTATGNLTNTATVGIPAGSSDPTVPNTATDTNTIAVQADLSIVKSNETTTVTAGGPISYEILVSNDGPSAVTGARVIDDFPDTLTGVTWTAVFIGGAAGADSGNGDIDELVNLPPDGAVIYSVTATVSNTAVGRIDNTATVTAPVNVTDPVPGNNTSTETDSVPAADLAVTKNDNLPGPVTAGETISYTILVSNPGTEPLAGVVLSDAVPTGTTLVSFTPPAGWTRTDTVPSGGTGQLRATRNSTLAGGVTESFTLVVRVNASAASGSNISNTAAVTTTTPGDVNPSNNSDQEVTPVQTRTDVSLTKAGSPTTVGANGLVTYTITVSNTGPSNASSLTFTDAIPAGTTFESFSAPGWTFTPPAVGGTGTITATRATLAPGAPSTLTLIVRADNSLSTGTTITNTASVATTTTESNPNNNTDTETTTVVVPPDFGDAPASYGTLSVNNGARHGSGVLRLGALVDSETDGQPNDTATGDDVNGIDDEEGVIVPGAMIVNRPAAVLVNATGAGRLDAWIDFNRNGVFDTSEQIATSLAVAEGSNTVFFAVPADAVTGGTFARFRLSSAGGLGPTGPAGDGEVEDHATSIIVVTPGTVGIIPDPELPGENMLLIAGTAASENISVTQLRTHRLKVQVNVNNRNRGTFNMANFRRIAAFAGAGNDTATIGLARPALLLGEEGNDRLTGHGGYDQIFGGLGNDTLNGGNGDDFLFGEEGSDRLNGGNGNDALVGGLGSDTLAGGSGRDLLIGGLSVDSLSGNAGDDILIGGTTAHDENRAALALIMAAVTPKQEFHSRVNGLGTLLNSSTVSDDGVRDRLDGSTDRDWYLDYLLADNNLGFNSRQDRRN